MKKHGLHLTGMFLLVLMILPMQVYSQDDDFYIEYCALGLAENSVFTEYQFQVAYELCYSGVHTRSQLGETELGVYLSENTSYGGSDVFLASYWSHVGSDDACEEELLNVTIPKYTETGSYYILFFADHEDTKSEDDEGNNICYKRIDVIPHPTKYLDASRSDVWLDQSAGTTETFEISSNTDWTIDITNVAPWMEFSPTSGSGDATITLTATTANPDPYTRTAVLTIVGTHVDDEIVYGNQYPSTCELEASASNVWLDQEAGSSETFEISSNIPWSIEINNDAPWMEVSPTSGKGDATIRLTASTENPDTWPRTAVLILSGHDVDDVTVYGNQRSVKVLDLSTSSIILEPGSGASSTFQISSNTSWDISDNADWLSIDPTSGSDDATITITANSANSGASSRSATITVEGDDCPDRQITVTQNAGSFLSASPVSVVLSATSGSNASIAVSSNISWTASENADWLTASPSSGSGAGSITLTTGSDNNGLSARAAIVTISGSGVADQDITVSQNPLPSLSVSPTTLNLASSSGATASFNVISNIAWSVSETADWLTVSPGSGSGSGSVTVTTTSENTSASVRSTTLSISGNGVSSKTITVEQKGLGNPPVLVYHAFLINDGIDGLPGNGNGIIEQNEYIDIQVIINNTGGVTATGVAATLSTLESKISVITSQSYFADVLPGNAQTCISAFRIYVADDAALKDYALTLDITSNEGNFSSSFMLAVAETSLVKEDERDRINIYPNPTDGKLSLKFSKPVNEGMLLISDMTGRVLEVNELKNQTLEYSLNIEHFESGAYLLQVVSKEYKLVHRILVK